MPSISTTVHCSPESQVNILVLATFSMSRFFATHISQLSTPLYSPSASALESPMSRDVEKYWSSVAFAGMYILLSYLSAPLPLTSGLV